MLNDWSHKVRAILKKYCPGNIKKILPSSQSVWNTRFYFGHQKLSMDNNTQYSSSDGGNKSQCMKEATSITQSKFMNMQEFIVIDKIICRRT